MKLLKPLLAFLILNFSFLILAKAQIVYTDVVPDVTITCNGSIPCNSSYALDLNNDGVIDYNITASTSAGTCFGSGTASFRDVGATCFNGNEIMSSSSGFPLSMNPNDTISQQNNFTSFSVLRHVKISWTCPVAPSGNWTTIADHFLGLRINVGGSIHYGWARLSVTAGIPSFAIRDYAYNTIPNQPILAGQTSCATPPVTLSANGSLFICQGDNVKLTANTTANQFQWQKNGLNISGATSQTYIVKTAGIYKCKVTNWCGSSSTSAGKTISVGLPCKDASFLSMTNATELEHLSVYPNPATNTVTVKIPSDDAGEISIVNLFGEIVETHRTVETDNYPSLHEMQIDVSKFSSGMYVVRWSSGENFEMKKFSVVK